MSRKVKWTLWMTGFGLLTATIVYVITGSIVWSIVGLLGAGIVGNAVVRAGSAT
ncbi:MAG TPA: hypothetical protein VFA46_04160 [Actinomycetes bacterium]|jgi:hypothetical protein|nr:hypothetical protein [Actinomycetes bacterium]